MNANKIAIVAVAFAGTLAAAAAQAHGRDDVQFSVTIGTPFIAPARPVYAPAPVFVPAPVVRYENRYDNRYEYRYEYRYDNRYEVRSAYRAPTRWDVDGDGIPNRYDRVYNPRWDVDGDGIPNRYDRFDNRKRTWR